MTVFLILYMKMFMINNPIQFNLLDSRVNTHFENSDINLDDIAPIVIPENPPWLNPKPTFNFELTQHKKSETKNQTWMGLRPSSRTNYPKRQEVVTSAALMLAKTGITSNEQSQRQ